MTLEEVQHLKEQAASTIQELRNQAALKRDDADFCRRANECSANISFHFMMISTNSDRSFYEQILSNARIW